MNQISINQYLYRVDTEHFFDSMRLFAVNWLIPINSDATLGIIEPPLLIFTLLLLLFTLLLLWRRMRRNSAFSHCLFFFSTHLSGFMLLIDTSN